MIQEVKEKKGRVDEDRGQEAPLSRQVETREAAELNGPLGNMSLTCPQE